MPDRYINAESLKRKCQIFATSAWKMKIKASAETIMNKFIDFIDETPTADVVEVVRCKHCKWRNKEYYGEQETEWVWYCPNVEHMVGDNWFCADGEKNE